MSTIGLGLIHMAMISTDFFFLRVGYNLVVPPIRSSFGGGTFTSKYFNEGSDWIYITFDKDV